MEHLLRFPIIPYGIGSEWGLYLRVGPNFTLELLRKERMMKSKDEMILDRFRQLTEENQIVTLAYLAAVLSAPAASPSDRPRDDAPTA